MNDTQKTLAPGDFRELTELHDMASHACDLLKAMANEWRLIILCQLSEGEKTVSELQSLLGLSQSALSQHLAVLRREKNRLGEKGRPVGVLFTGRRRSDQGYGNPARPVLRGARRKEFVTRCACGGARTLSICQSRMARLAGGIK